MQKVPVTESTVFKHVKNNFKKKWHIFANLGLSGDDDPTVDEILARPRNVEQLRNLKTTNNRQQRLSWDELYNHCKHHLVLLSSISFLVILSKHYLFLY